MQAPLLLEADWNTRKIIFGEKSGLADSSDATARWIGAGALKELKK